MATFAGADVSPVPDGECHRRFKQSVGAAWFMLSFGAGPIYVALIQTASSLPFFLFALPAGSVGDIVDRRKLILLTEGWMIGIAVVLAALTIAGVMSPWLLLVLTFANSAGWRPLMSTIGIRIALFWTSPYNKFFLF